MRITVETSDRSFYSELSKAKIEGLHVSVRNTDSITPSEILTIVVTVASTVIMERFINWACDHFKKKPDQKTVINGNQINIGTTNVTYLTQIITGENKDKGNDNETGGINKS